MSQVEIKRNTYRHFVATVFLLLCGQLAFAREDFDFTQQLRAAYTDIQKLRLEKAGVVLKTVAATQPANGFVPYLESYSDFFYFLITDNQRDYTAFSRRQEKRLQQVAALSGKSPYQRMLMAEIRLHSAFVKLKFGSRTSGSWDIVKANKLLQENRKLFPDFVPQLKALGLLHVMIGSVPDEYQWVARLMGLKGDVREGIAELKRVENESPAFAREARVTALLLHAYILTPDEKLISTLKELPFGEPDNLLFHFLAASILMKRGESEAALTILNKAPQGEGYLPFPFLHYMKAEANLQKGVYGKAKVEYASFRKSTQGRNFVKDSYFKQYICQWLEGEEPDRSLLDKVLAEGSLNVEADKYAYRTAERFLTSGLPGEQRALYRARYAFDGGFNDEAWSALTSRDESSFTLLQSRIEYNYRIGRVLQYQGKNNEAIVYLRRTVEMNEGYDFYFGPSAALQLGYIYNKKGQPKIAEAYFRKAISFKKHEYKNSIDNKARAGLTEMGK